MFRWRRVPATSWHRPSGGPRQAGCPASSRGSQRTRRHEASRGHRPGNFRMPGLPMPPQAASARLVLPPAGPRRCHRREPAEQGETLRGAPWSWPEPGRRTRAWARRCRASPGRHSKWPSPGNFFPQRYGLGKCPRLRCRRGDLSTCDTRSDTLPERVPIPSAALIVGGSVQVGNNPLGSIRYDLGRGSTDSS